MFTAADDLPNGPALVVLGHGLWAGRYGADRRIVGRTVLLDGQPHEVIGVMPAGFVLPTDFNRLEPTVLWTPLGLDPASMDHGSHGLYGVARLADGFTVEQASDELRAITEALTRAGIYPSEMRFSAFAVSVTDEVVGPVRRSIWVLSGAVLLLLLLSTVNVATLMLARAEARHREMALRAALGAGRARLVGQLLAEGLVLASVGAAAGLGLAYMAVRVLVAWSPAIPRLASLTIDARALWFTSGLLLLTSVLVSLAPGLWATAGPLAETLKDSGPRAEGGFNDRRRVLVVGEMIFAVVLLVGAGLMLRTVRSLQQIDLGLSPAHVLTLQLSLPQAAYPDPEPVVGFYQRLIDEVRQLPGVRAAGAVRSLPLAAAIGDWGLDVEGFVPPAGASAKGDWQIVTDGYVEAIGERVVRGRAFLATDRSETHQVGLVNEEMARRYWPGEDPVGRRFRVNSDGDRPWVSVVGVVGDVRHNGVTEVVKEKFYRPHSQWHRSTGSPLRSMTLVVKTDGDPLQLVAPVRALVRRIDPNLPIAAVRPMSDVVGSALATPRFIGMLMTIFATLALLLAATGVYGVLSFVVSQRTREIGIRLAIGAGRASVLRLIVGHALSLSAVGIAIGLVLAGSLAPLVGALLHGVASLDPLTFGAAAGVLVLIGIVASLLPAIRAMRVDPVMALRND